MKNLTLIMAMSLGLFVLGISAKAERPKAMYFGTSRNGRLPLFFKDNGDLRCPGSKVEGKSRDNLLKRFGVNVATRFQDDPTREDFCGYFWTCNGFGPYSASLRGSCPFPTVFEPSKEKCVFFTDAKSKKCKQYYASEFATQQAFNQEKYNYDTQQGKRKEAKRKHNDRHKQAGMKNQQRVSSQLAADNSKAHLKNVNVQKEWIHERSKRGARRLKNFNVETDFETILDITRNADGSLSCPPVYLLEDVTLAEVFEAAREHKTLNNFNPPHFYNMKSFTHGYETRLAVVKADGKYDCTRYYECGWKQHVYNGNQPELKSCQKNAVFTPTKIKKYRKWEVEFHGFDGFTYVEKTGRCVNNSDIIGADMDHCKGLFADGMEYWTPSGFHRTSPVINIDSTVNQEEPRDLPDYVEPEYPVENKDNSDSDDYIEKLLKEIRDQDNYNEEPSEEIIPKVNPEWQVVDKYPVVGVVDPKWGRISLLPAVNEWKLTPREAGLKAHREAEQKIIQAQQKIQPNLEVDETMTAEEKSKKEREDGLKLHQAAEEKILQAQREIGGLI